MKMFPGMPPGKLQEFVRICLKIARVQMMIPTVAILFHVINFFMWAYLDFELRVSLDSAETWFEVFIWSSWIFALAIIVDSVLLDTSEIFKKRYAGMPKTREEAFDSGLLMLSLSFALMPGFYHDKFFFTGSYFHTFEGLLFASLAPASIVIVYMIVKDIRKRVVHRKFTKENPDYLTPPQADDPSNLAQTHANSQAEEE